MKKLKIIFIVLIFTTCIFAQEVIPLKGIFKPKTLAVKDGKIFITEFFKINVYSVEGLKLITQFGKKGEGPGEFKIFENAENGIGVQISVQKDYILANSISRISWFNRDGIFLREKNTHMPRLPYGSNLVPLGNKFVGYGFINENNTRYNTINIYDENLKIQKELHRHPFFVQPGKKINLEVWRPSLYFVTGEEIIIDSGDGQFKIFNTSGEEVSSFEPILPKVKETAQRKEEYLEFLRKDPRFKYTFEQTKRMFTFPKYLPLIQTFTVDENTIYVITNKKEGGKNLLHLYDFKGNLIKQVKVGITEKTPMEPYPFAISKHVLYQLNENLEKEEWEIHITRL